ncbi:MAG: capsular biosynthesis protein [Gammaproteobacteria bacterium]|nr:capsular biosynthesis protein [Gammaproteobacteria bacterium]|tara:strand:+ start:86406 stop:87158 length:753 start_codon:yes stop_codon:yes gene_type:complete
MIDLHCHLLPGIDDGPDTLEQALELARIAVANGITHSVLTPHIHPGRYENDAASIQAELKTFRAALEAENIPLQLGFAGEVRLSAEIPMMIEQGQIPFYGELDGYHVFLLELPHSHVPPGSDKLVEWLLQRNIRPMIAHPERNKDIMRKPDKIQPFIELDCLFQLTAGSVAGDFGEAAQNTARLILETGKVSVLASDAHNALYRPPRLDHGRDAAAEIVGSDAAHELVFDRPRQLIQNQFADLRNGDHLD